MAYKIDAAECTVCGACEAECPNKAIRMRGDAYYINPDKYIWRFVITQKFSQRRNDH